MTKKEQHWEKKFRADELAKLYKEYEEKLEKMGSMEVCNCSESCNDYVSKQLIEKIRQEKEKSWREGVKDLVSKIQGLMVKEEKNYLKIDSQDIQTLINMLEGDTERRIIINFIQKYIAH